MPYKQVMHKWKEGTLHSGSKQGPVVQGQKQAVAIMLSEKRKSVSKPEYRSKEPMKVKKYQAGTAIVDRPAVAIPKVKDTPIPKFPVSAIKVAKAPVPSYMSDVRRFQKGTANVMPVPNHGAPPNPMPMGPQAKAVLPQAKIHVNRHTANAGQMPVLPHAKVHMQRHAANPPAGSMPQPPKGPAFPISAPVNPEY